MKIRVGFGFDVHPLAAGYPLVLGGVNFDYPLGAVGHSDADVLLHAIADALLGAAALGDIGQHFKNTDPQWKGVSSLVLLKKVKVLLEEAGWQAGNVDAMLCLEEPKVMKHAAEMREKIAGVLGVEASDVSVKATTAERLGFVGRQEGVVAYAVCLIERTVR